MRKETSTNSKNKKNLEADCGMAYTVSVLNGRWKLSILAYLLENSLRYGELKRKLPGISERMLITQLKELESDELVNRTAYPEVPPRVEYTLSKKGRSLKKILMQLSDWGELHKLKKS